MTNLRKSAFILSAVVLGSTIGFILGQAFFKTIKLYVVVYVFGHIAASVGPLPYKSMTMCRTDALPYLLNVQKEGWAESVANGTSKKLPIVDGHKFRGPIDVVNRCEWHFFSPVHNTSK